MQILIAGVYVELNASTPEQAVIQLVKRFSHVLPEAKDVQAALWLTSLVDSWADFYSYVGFTMPPSEVKQRAYRNYNLIKSIAHADNTTSQSAGLS